MGLLWSQCGPRAGARPHGWPSSLHCPACKRPWRATSVPWRWSYRRCPSCGSWLPAPIARCVAWVLLLVSSSACVLSRPCLHFRHPTPHIVCPAAPAPAMTPGTLGPLGAVHSGRAGCSHGESGCGGAGSRLPAPTGLLGGRGSSSRATLGTCAAPCPLPTSQWQHSLRAPARLAYFPPHHPRHRHSLP